MSATFTFADPLTVSDLRLYLSRATRIENGSVRLSASGGVLAVYTAVLYPRSLLDTIPTVLGLRTFSVAAAKPWDGVVPARELLTKLDRMIQPESSFATLSVPLRLDLPPVPGMSAATASWAGMSPPRDGWYEVGELLTNCLRDSARAGMAKVASILPGGGGEQLIRRVRSQVWGTTMSGTDYLPVKLPAGAAFAAESLGFLGTGDNEQAHVFSAGHWLRLSLQRGHVLVKTVDTDGDGTSHP